MLGSVPYRLKNIGLGTVSFPVGTLMRADGKDAIYIIGSTGQRHHITDRLLFDGLLLFLHDVRNLPTATVSAIPQGHSIDTPQKYYDLFPKNQMPREYLVQLDRKQIDEVVRRKLLYHADGTAKATCSNGEGGKLSINDHLSCTTRLEALRFIETGNLLFANSHISHEELLKHYAKAEGLVSNMPQLLHDGKFGEQLKRNLRLIVSAVAGFVTMGPIGIFIGAAGEVTRHIQSERAKFQGMAQATNYVTQAAYADLNPPQAEAGFNISPGVVIGTLAASGLLLLFGDELKKLMQSKN